MTTTHGSTNERRGLKIAKEFLFGLLAIGLGVYNLLSQMGIINLDIAIPQLIGNVLLVVVGLLLWMTAYKLWRYRWHTQGLF